MEWDSESVKSEDLFKQPGNPEGERKVAPSTPQSYGGVRLHEFVSKTVRMSFNQTRKALYGFKDNIYFCLKANKFDQTWH